MPLMLRQKTMMLKIAILNTCVFLFSSLHLGRKYTIILNNWTAVKEILPHSSALDRSPNIFDHIPSVGKYIDVEVSFIVIRRISE